MSSYKATLLRRGFQALKDGFGGQLQTQTTATLQLQGPDVAQGLLDGLGVPAQELRHSDLGFQANPAAGPQNAVQAAYLRQVNQASQAAPAYLRVPQVRDYFQQLRVGPLAFNLNQPAAWAATAQKPSNIQLPPHLQASSQLARNNNSGASASGQSGGALQDNVDSGQSGKRKGSANSVHINKQIMACRNIAELLALVKARGAQFDGFNTSSALARVPKLLANTNEGSGAAGDAVHLDHAGRALMECLGDMMCRNIDGFDARGLANAAWAIGKTKYTPQAALPALISAAARAKLNDFNAQNLSNLMWSQVYMHHDDPALFAVVAEKAKARINEFKPQELANMIWSFASLGYKDEHLAAIVARQAVLLARSFKEQELSNVLWAYGKLGYYDAPLFNALLAEARTRLDNFLPQGISNVAWACAAVGHADREFLDRVVRASAGRLHSFDVQALSNLAWALATLGHPDTGLMAAVVREGMTRLERMSPQNMSNMLWSCATLGVREPRMLEAWASQTLEKLQGFEPQGLSNTAWSFAKLGHRDPLLFDALASAAAEKADAFTPQGLSNTAYAFALAGHCHPELFQRMAQALVRKMEAGGSSPALGAAAAATTPAAAGGAGAGVGASANAANVVSVQNCSVMVWAYAMLRHYDEALFDAVAAQLVAAADTCEAQNLTNILWAYARMGHSLGEAGPALARRALELLPSMNQQEAANTFRSLALLDLLDESSFAAFADALAGSETGLSPEGLHQAYQAQLAFHSNLKKHRRAQAAAAANHSNVAHNTLARGSGDEQRQHRLPCLPEPLLSAAEQMWRAAATRGGRVSRLQQDVSSALSAVGVENTAEHVTADGLLTVDVTLEVAGRPVAVVVGGRTAYSSNAPHRPLGDVAIRKRLLEERGWAVVEVSFAEWEALGGGGNGGGGSALVERGEGLVAHVAAQLGVPDWRPPAVRAAVQQQRQYAAAIDSAAAAAAMGSWLSPAALALSSLLQQQSPDALQLLAAQLAATEQYPSTGAAAAATAEQPQQPLAMMADASMMPDASMSGGFPMLPDDLLGEDDAFTLASNLVALQNANMNANLNANMNANANADADVAADSLYGLYGSMQAEHAVRAVSVLQSSPEGMALLMQNVYSQLGMQLPMHMAGTNAGIDMATHGNGMATGMMAMPPMSPSMLNSMDMGLHMGGAAGAATARTRRGSASNVLGGSAAAALLAQLNAHGVMIGGGSGGGHGSEEDGMDYDLEQLERCVQLAIN